MGRAWHSQCTGPRLPGWASLLGCQPGCCPRGWVMSAAARGLTGGTAIEGGAAADPFLLSTPGIVAGQGRDGCGERLKRAGLSMLSLSAGKAVKASHAVTHKVTHKGGWPWPSVRDTRQKPAAMIGGHVMHATTYQVLQLMRQRTASCQVQSYRPSSVCLQHVSSTATTLPAPYLLLVDSTCHGRAGHAAVVALGSGPSSNTDSAIGEPSAAFATSPLLAGSGAASPRPRTHPQPAGQFGIEMEAGSAAGSAAQQGWGGGAASRLLPPGSSPPPHSVAGMPHSREVAGFGLDLGQSSRGVGSGKGAPGFGLAAEPGQQHEAGLDRAESEGPQGLPMFGLDAQPTGGTGQGSNHRQGAGQGQG
ncbi:hypothetical protein HaLaN_24123 [Haematococcus lacustris]|uniref:Uncharacterized protein n=1 Tax=Haematococcus lacustris TaxID=44745 RepID=A0A6A0A239_HAELA|nr:hypothetical protein HaLaN_24123 [Haematococcus lacustris]